MSDLPIFLSISNFLSLILIIHSVAPYRIILLISYTILYPVATKTCNNTQKYYTRTNDVASGLHRAYTTLDNYQMLCNNRPPAKGPKESGQAALSISPVQCCSSTSSSTINSSYVPVYGVHGISRPGKESALTQSENWGLLHHTHLFRE